MRGGKAGREGGDSFGANLDVVVGIEGETVVYSGWKHNHVTLFAIDPDPLLVLVTDVKVPCTPPEADVWIKITSI